MNEDGITREPIYAIWENVPGSDIRRRISKKLVGIIYKMYLDDDPNCPDFVAKGDFKVDSANTLKGIQDKVREVRHNVEFIEYVRATKGE